VCTLTRAETIDVDEWIASELPELIPQSPPPAPFRPWGRGGLLVPHAAGTDGMFVLVTTLAAPMGRSRSRSEGSAQRSSRFGPGSVGSGA
jgi:hypothetical protein